jgi:hypothetical protein
LHLKEHHLKTRTFFALSSLSVFALAGALATSPASAAPNGGGGIDTDFLKNFDVKTTIKNATDHDNWVDISEGYKMKVGWSIQHAFCLTPGQSQTPIIRVNGLPYPEIRVRAEVKRGDCKSGNLTSVSTHMDIPDPKTEKGSYRVTYLTSETRGKGSNYHVVINER